MGVVITASASRRGSLKLKKAKGLRSCSEVPASAAMASPPTVSMLSCVHSRVLELTNLCSVWDGITRAIAGVVKRLDESGDECDSEEDSAEDEEDPDDDDEGLNE
jgi:hypothetical protein